MGLVTASTYWDKTRFRGNVLPVDSQLLRSLRVFRRSVVYEFYFGSEISALLYVSTNMQAGEYKVMRMIIRTI